MVITISNLECSVGTKASAMTDVSINDITCLFHATICSYGSAGISIEYYTILIPSEAVSQFLSFKLHV